MKNSPKKIGMLLAKLSADAKSKEEASKITKDFAELIVSKRIASKTPAIIRSFRKEWNNLKGIVDVTIKAASLAEAPEIKHIGDKKAEVTFIEDKSLIGGAEIKIDDLVIDTSIKSKLQKVKSQIAN